MGRDTEAAAGRRAFWSPAIAWVAVGIGVTGRKVIQKDTQA